MDRKHVAVLAVLMFLTFYSLFLTSEHMFTLRRGKIICSVDDYMNAIARYISQNGAHSLDEELPPCAGLQRENSDINLLHESLKDLNYYCSQKKYISVEKEIKSPVLTLFTSFRVQKEKHELHNNTIQNWSSFLPNINLIVFTNDTEVKTYCKNRGWTALPILHHAAGGVPVLKTMFTTAMKLFQTPFYGYSNADILFTGGLLETILKVKKRFGVRKSILITGRRFNIPMILQKEVISNALIESTIERRGTIFVESSEDYFFTSANFKWDNIPDLVIGRPAFDNWLVSEARCTGSVVVDGTRTAMAAHQTTKIGNMEGWTSNFTSYNNLLLRKLKRHENYDQGIITCVEYESYYSICKSIDILQRNLFKNHCKCKKKSL